MKSIYYKAHSYNKLFLNCFTGTYS